MFLGRNSRTRFFSNIFFFYKKLKDHLQFCAEEKKNMNEYDFCQNPKNLFLGSILGLFEPS